MTGLALPLVQVSSEEWGMHLIKKTPAEPGRVHRLSSISQKSYFAGDLVRSLCFYTPPQDGQPPKYISDDPSLKGSRNYPHHEVPVQIRDIREIRSKFTLARHGFAALTKPDMDNVDFTIDEQVETYYLPKVRNLILDYLCGSQSVIVFDTTIRQAAASGRCQKPVRKIHVDQSPRGAYRRARHVLPKGDAEMVLEGERRYRIINVWKPIYNEVMDHPLVFADSRSVLEEDLIPVEQVYPHYVGETYATRHNPEQEYWYWSNMTTHDIILFQCFDSIGELNENGEMESARCAHGSFNLSGTKDELSARSSIEVRCIVLG